VLDVFQKVLQNEESVGVSLPCYFLLSSILTVFKYESPKPSLSIHIPPVPHT
jgi:hypothetical protein